MPFHRVTYKFGAAVVLPGSAIQPADAGTGWSETFYDNRDLTDVACINSWGPAGSQFGARRAMLTQGWRIVSVSAQRFPGTRAGIKIGVTPADGNGRYLAPGAPGVGGQDEAAYDRLVVTLTSAGGRIRSWLMGGIGPDVVTNSGQYSAAGAFPALFANFISQLNLGGALRISTPGTLRGMLSVNIGDNNAPGVVVPSPSAPLINVNGPAPELVAGAVVKIGPTRSMSGLSGLWIIDSIVTGAQINVQLRAKRGRQVVGKYQGESTVRVVAYSLDAIVSGSPQYGTSRRTGGPPVRRRGRRKIQR